MHARSVELKFTADRYECINHKCWAKVTINPKDARDFEVNSWGDEYADHDEMSEIPNGVYESICEAVMDYASEEGIPF